jgi:hypothetical protein
VVALLFHLEDIAFKENRFPNANGHEAAHDPRSADHGMVAVELAFIRIRDLTTWKIECLEQFMK